MYKLTIFFCAKFVDFFFVIIFICNVRRFMIVALRWMGIKLTDNNGTWRKVATHTNTHTHTHHNNDANDEKKNKDGIWTWRSNCKQLCCVRSGYVVIQLTTYTEKREQKKRKKRTITTQYHQPENKKQKQDREEERLAWNGIWSLSRTDRTIKPLEQVRE